MDLDGIALGLLAQVEDALLQAGPGDDPPGVAGKEVQQLELPGREIHRGVGHPQDTGVHIKGELAQPPQAAGEPRAAPDQGPYTGQQFRNGEGLHQVVVGTPVQSTNPVLHGVPGGEDEHRRQVIPAAHVLEHVQARSVREPQVQQDGVEALGLEVEVPVLHAPGPRRRIDRVVEGLQEGTPQLGIVFDEQESGGRVQGSDLRA